MVKGWGGGGQGEGRVGGWNDLTNAFTKQASYDQDLPQWSLVSKPDVWERGGTTSRVHVLHVGDGRAHTACFDVP